MVAFQSTLATMLPVDLAAFLRTATVDMAPSVLVILAQLWLPGAQATFCAALREQTGSLTGAVTGRQLGIAVQQAVAQQKQPPAGEAERARQAAETAIMHEQGMQRFFGPTALATRLGLPPPADASASGQHGKAARRGEAARPDEGGLADLADSQVYSRCQELVDRLCQPWSPPSTLDQFETLMALVDTQLQQMPGWARFGGDYVRPHILRKLSLLYLESGPLRDLSWGDLPRESWARASPDQHRLLDGIPDHWPTASIARLAPGVNPPLLSMWACLFHSALRTAASRAWAAQGNSVAFAAAVASFRASHGGVAPSPAQAVQIAMAAARASPSAGGPGRQRAQGAASGGKRRR